ncbi:interferon-induced protein 44-like isoform 2-T2 [Pholidichthys leucotaenia]
MVRTYKRKTERGTTSEAQYKAAARDVDNGMSIREAARHHDLCCMTLSRYIRRVRGDTAPPLPGYSTHRQVFTQEQEILLAHYLQQHAELHFGVSATEARKMAFQFAKQFGISCPDAWHRNECAGEDWLLGFCKRYQLFLQVATSFKRQATQPSTSSPQQTAQPSTSSKQQATQPSTSFMGESSSFAPHDVMPIPDAERKGSPGKVDRRKRKSEILTDSPVKKLLVEMRSSKGKKENQKVMCNLGDGFNFEAAEMYENDLNLTRPEVYPVKGLRELLDKPWRSIQWTAERKQQLTKAIVNYEPDVKSVHQARVLLIGPVGAGKSSFFNSINSAFRGSMTSQAIAGTAGTSVTTQFRTYTIKAGKGGRAVPLILCDTMGLEENAGLDVEDLVTIYKGHMKDRYQFSISGPLSEDAPGFKKHVTLKDKMHCVVYVVDTCKVSLLSPKMLDKFAVIRKKTNQMGIPQLLLMTKVDEACPQVAKDLKNVYHSVYIQKKARELSECLGIPLTCVLPVKNYCEELELDQDTDILLFTAVEQMLNYADSFFENQVVEDQEEVDSV